MLGSVALAGFLPHIFKRLVNRKRPNRAEVHIIRHGVRRLGDKWDSFPSGHALHLGALAVPLSRLAPSGIRPVVWPACVALAATRIVLLAHYPTDVAAGLALGALLHRMVRGGLRKVEHALSGPRI